jgi:hypothetical protein
MKLSTTDQPFYLFTSVPPQPSEEALQQQRDIISSWRAAGFTPVTVNGPSEIQRIAGFDLDIEIETASDDGRPLVSDILAAIKKKGGHRAGIINADCEMLEYPELASTLASVLENGLLYAERIDIGDHRPPTIGECHGFDAFFFDVDVLGSTTDRHFRLGETWWDYWFPLQLAANGAILGNIDRPIILHRRHTARWGDEQWMRNGRHCWMEIETLRRQKAIPVLFSSSNAPVGRAQPDHPQLSELGTGCFNWLRTRKFSRKFTFLSDEMKSIETLLRESYSSLVLVPQLKAELLTAKKRLSKKVRDQSQPKSWIRRLNRRRLHWKRQVFGRHSDRRWVPEKSPEMDVRSPSATTPTVD